MWNRILYGIMSLIALTIYLLQRSCIPLPTIINNYVNDALCLPLVFATMTFVIRYLKKDDLFLLPMGILLFIASYYAVYFEYYLPKINPRYTKDWIDVVLYFSSALGYFFYEKQTAVIK